MSERQDKRGYFNQKALNYFATVYYFYYLYFFTQTVFGFSNEANLALAAFNGLIYMVFSFLGGRFAQRFGYFTALKLGFVIMLVALATGTRVASPGAQILVMAVAVVGMCFTWPTIEALVSEGETPAGVQQMIGIYNVVWAGTGAVAYFTGGAMLQKLGLKSLFYVPIVVQLGQLGLTLWLEQQAQGSVKCRVSSGKALGSDECQVSSGKGVSGSLCSLDTRRSTLDTRVELNPRPIAK